MNLLKRRTRVSLPICKRCVTLSVICQQNTLGPSAGRHAFARRPKRGMIFTRRGTTRRRSSEPRRPSWCHSVISAVSLILTFDPIHCNNPRSQATPRGSPSPRTAEGRAREVWTNLGRDIKRGQAAVKGITAFGRLLRGSIGQQLTNI